MARLHPPQVSVLMPVRNGENFLKQAIESVLMQEFENYELIVGINPSEDSTVSVAKSVLGSKHKGIIIFRDKVSMPHNFNRTAAHASGNLIKFLCHDDILYPNALQLLSEMFIQNQNVVLASSFESFFGGERPARDTKSLGKAKYVGRLRSLYRFHRYGNWLGGPSGVMVRREPFLKTTFDSNFPCAFDLDCWINLLKFGGIGIVQDVLYATRIHSKQATNSCHDGGFFVDLNGIRSKNMQSTDFLIRSVARFIR